jgi:hypothetical protein
VRSVNGERRAGDADSDAEQANDRTERAGRRAASDADSEGSALLRAQQMWLLRAVTAPDAEPLADGPPPALDAARVLTPGPRLTAAERLAIYRDGYRGRLVECLADDYAAVQFFLGEAAFEALAHDYIEQHPSRSPNLNAFGRSMASFLGARAGEAGPFAADLARLEWAIVEAIHAAPSPPLALDRFEHMSPEQWSVARLVPAASVRVLRLAHPANAYYQAFRTEGHPSPPPPAPTATLVHRRGWVVWRTDLEPAMARLLEAIVGGAPLGEALAASIADEDEGTQAHVTHSFQDWVGGGVFTAVELPDS